MQYLYVKNLHKSYTDIPLFEGIDFTIYQGQKVALVAKNGAGKSTLLDILLGHVDAPVGEVTFTKGVKVDYLAQSLSLDPSLKVREVLIHHENELGQLILRYETACADTTSSPHYIHQLLEEIEQKDARSFETKVKTIISKLHLQSILEQEICSLSGGEQKRVALAITLLNEPDFLILDEPTNHLDVEMIERLEKELTSSTMTLLFVSHDRYFIERVATHILELEHGHLFSYTGGYDSYLEQKAQRLEQLSKQTHIQKQRLKHELDRVRKAPRARGSKSVERTSRYYALEDMYQKNKRLTDGAQKKLSLSVETRRLGNKVLQIHNLSKSFGDKCIVADFSYVFKAGERVGIIGKNGVGKSTFINLLLQEEQADHGQIKIGDTVVIGYYQQHEQDYATDKTVLDVVREHAEQITLGKKTLSASKLLERFMFPPAQQYTRASSLSGGEKRRLHLLTVLITNPNVLILDEPTNDLDLVTLHVLEEFLLQYTGCLMIISHDRFFMDRLVDHLLVFTGEGQITDFRGTYTERKKTEKQSSSSQERSGEVGQSSPPASPGSLETFPEKKGLTYMEKRELEDVEKEIANLQAQQEQINLSFQQENLSHDLIKELSKELGTVCKQLEKAEKRRCELAQKR